MGTSYFGAVLKRGAPVFLVFFYFVEFIDLTVKRGRYV